jgi:nucleotide-binding universal stress UspA family protein
LNLFKKYIRARAALSACAAYFSGASVPGRGNETGIFYAARLCRPRKKGIVVLRKDRAASLEAFRKTPAGADTLRFASFDQEAAMPDIKNILCAVDLSEHSKTVAEYAIALAKAFDAKVTVLYTAPSLSQYVGFHVPPSSIENFVGEIVTGAEQSMEEFIAECFTDPAVRTEGKILSGYAAQEIVGYAHTNAMDIIVMGTHGRTGIDRMLFGSVAEKVVKTAAIPVMTIRPKG